MTAVDKSKNAVVYQTKIKDLLAAKVLPEKHQGHPESYKQFLENELRIVTNQIEKVKA